MYEIFRTAFNGNGQTMRLTVTVYPADRNQFILNIGQVPDRYQQRIEPGDLTETRSAEIRKPSVPRFIESRRAPSQPPSRPQPSACACTTQLRCQTSPGTLKIGFCYFLDSSPPDKQYNGPDHRLDERPCEPCLRSLRTGSNVTTGRCAGYSTQEGMVSFTAATSYDQANWLARA